jgi:hypothetical protein
VRVVVVDDNDVMDNDNETTMDGVVVVVEGDNG